MQNPEPILNAARARRMAVAMGALAVIATLLMALQPVRSPDVWHHVKSGWLVAQQGPAQTDPFSCTAQGQRWIQYEWLAQTALYGVWAAGGIAGLILLQVAMVALMAFLLFKTARARGVAPFAAAVAVALAVCAASDRIYTRPELFTWVILGAWLLSIEKLRTGAARWVIAFPLLMALWVNMHGAWPAGLALIGLVCGAETILLLLRRPNAITRRTLGMLWVAFALALVATLANPYGVRIWEVPFQLAQSPEVRASIAEWRRPGLSDWLDLRNIGIAALIASLIAAPRALRLRDLFVLLFFAALALSARRHIALAMLVITPIIASQLEAAWAALARRSEAMRIWASSVAAIPLLCIALLLTVLLALGFRFERAGVGLEKRLYPIGAANYLAANHLDGNLFNSYMFGNYLLFARYPQNHVFIDGRVDMYGSRAVKLYDQVRRAAPGWQEILAQYNISICVLDTTRTTELGLIKALQADPNWALIYWDANSAIFVKRVPEHEALLRGAYVYRYLPATFNIDEIHSRDELLRAEAEFRHCALNLTGVAALGRVQSALGHFFDAWGSFSAAVTLEPRNGALHYELGVAIMEANTSPGKGGEEYQRAALNEAAAEFRKAIALHSQEGSAHLALSVLLQRQNDLSGAIHEARAALKFSPENWKIHWNLSILYEQSGDLARALAEMDEVIKRAPSQQAEQRRSELRARVMERPQR